MDRLLLVCGFLFLTQAATAQASEDKFLFDLKVPPPASTHGQPPALAPEIIYRRTQQVLQYFQVPAEPDMQSFLDGIEDHASQADLDHWLPYFDPSQQFARFFSVDNGRLTGFYDRDGKQVVDFTSNGFSGLAAPPPPTILRKPLAVPGHPLAGLRIALDPGHMGTTFWDQETGKWVKDSAGHIVSEGLINLQVCLLLKQAFTDLGAEVVVTREELKPVTDKGLQDIDLQAFGRQELRERSLEPWFQTLLNASDPAVRDTAFAASSEVKAIFGEGMRSDYFILREDLDARAAIIEAFKPDLTLIIHFDAISNLLDPNTKDETRGYVPGGMADTEFANSTDRAQMVAHLLQPDRLQGSVAVTQSIVNEISSQLGAPKPIVDLPGTVEISPGVFARNLALNHEVTTGILSYMECLVYGSSTEFPLLLHKDYTMQIGGQPYPYSKRLLAVANAIRDGVVNYYQN